MTSNVKLKDAFNADLKYGAFYTGGTVVWTSDRKEILCQNYSSIKILDVTSGAITKTLGDEDNDLEEDTLNTFTCSPDNESIVTSHKSGLLKLWSKSEQRIIKMWRSIHKGPISKLAVNKANQLASGGSDGSIRLWDLKHQACTHNLKESQGVISVLKYNNKEVFGAGDDLKIHAWNTETGKLVSTLSGHYSRISDIDFHPNGVNLVSSSRDKVIILWDVTAQVSVKVIPIYESVESIVILPRKFICCEQKVKSDDVHVACAGESGFIRIWNMTKAKEVFVQKNSLIAKAAEDGGLSITQLLFNNNQFLVVSFDHNLVIHDLETFSCVKQFSGFSDEILDVVFLADDTHLAVATNSADIKLYSVENMNCQLVKGHTDLVLALARCKANSNLMLSAGKDNTIRLWTLNPADFTIECLAIGNRHMDSVGSVAFSNLSCDFCASVSQDNCIKLWTIDADKKILDCTLTEIAHDKDINCVTVSPNDKLIATASQDKTVKLWSAENLKQFGILRGHKRGVWTVRFSPIDQVILTTSADCTIKLWSVNEMACLKTIEGHESSVLRGEFLSKGQQIVTSGADGLVKLWTIKTSECDTTLDEHSGRVWALAVARDEGSVVTGGSDSLLIKWRDVTVEKRREEEERQRDIVLQEQELNNLLQSNELLKALKVALKLERPYKVLKIIERVVKAGQAGLHDTILQLDNYHKEMLVKTAVVWNTNSKNCYCAQVVLNILMNDLLAGNFKPSGFSSIVEDLIPYTERHFNRVSKHLQDLHLLTYVVNCMQGFENISDV